MSESVSLSSIKSQIFTLRKELAEINGESPIEEKNHQIYLWKGLKIYGHKKKPIVKITIVSPEDYGDVPEMRYLLLLIRDDMLQERAIITRELISKVKGYDGQ